MKSTTQRYQDKCRRPKGFTLLEILVVLVILGLLASLVGPQVFKQLSSSKSKTASLQIEELSSALDLYRLEVGGYPTSEQGLDALINKPANIDKWNGPYLKKSIIRDDPWGNAYIYVFPGEHGEFDLYSLGADKQEGGEGENKDVKSWE
ncbi:type II secretion system major pseudopilin GspG [uncultured Neptuniibacter sp.]|uniref:type II secretion system major pseudopilin GspG n=1 Tax=uncultured Neptuniibacter sp. TaxID=502143 RepID=UPI00260F8A60|nr:type II secretion system major pseudopilin GspG [uncultured Neptuniibacter sp.]